MKEIKVKILKINIVGKWAELWLEGIPFQKETIWNDEKSSIETTNNDAWNFCCKSYFLSDWYKEANPEIKDEDLNYDFFLDKFCIWQEGENNNDKLIFFKNDIIN